MSKFLNYLANSSRIVKGVLLLCFDAAILGFSMLLAFAVRFDPTTMKYQYNEFLVGVWVLIGMQLLSLMTSSLYRSVLRYAGAEILVLLLRSVLLGTGLFTLLDLLIDQFMLPRSIIVINASFAY